MHVKAKVAAGDRILINVDPDWKKGNYRVIVQKRHRGAWTTVSRTKTRGARDTRSLDPRRGTYRILVKRKGFEVYRTNRLRLRR